MLKDRTISPIYSQEEDVERCINNIVNNIVPKVRMEMKIVMEEAYRIARKKIDFYCIQAFRKFGIFVERI